VASIVLAANREALAQTLSLVIASQLVFGLAIDRLSASSALWPRVRSQGSLAKGVGLVKVVGALLILTGGVLVVRAQ
jgi:uncharacterized membrane protein YdcZ (DUF606 family)